MTDPWRPFRPGDDPAAQRYMTPDQHADCLERVRAAEASAAHRGAMQAAAHRWGPSLGKLSPDAITAICEDRARGRTLRELADQHGVSPATISRAVQRRKRPPAPAQ